MFWSFHPDHPFYVILLQPQREDKANAHFADEETEAAQMDEELPGFPQLPGPQTKGLHLHPVPPPSDVLPVAPYHLRPLGHDIKFLNIVCQVLYYKGKEEPLLAPSPRKTDKGS